MYKSILDLKNKSHIYHSKELNQILPLLKLLSVCIFVYIQIMHLLFLKHLLHSF